MADRNNVARDLADQLKGAFGDLVFKAAIPRSLKIEESHSRFQSVLHYAPRSSGATAYRSLVEQIAAHGQREEDRARGSRRRPASPAHAA
jgi:chromosome partitioning protein